MNSQLSKYLFYYPITLLKGERVLEYLYTYNKNQNLNINEINTLQIHYLRKLLKYAYKNCPFYTKNYKDSPETIYHLQGLQDLENLPTISKQDIITFHSSISANLPFYQISHKTTGGSSGHPVTIQKNVTALARERAATWRGYSWAGINVGDPQARFWGTPLAQSDRIKNKIIDLFANRIRLSAFDISCSSMNAYYKNIIKFKPRYLYGYVSMIESFCQHLHDEKLNLPDSVSSIITTSEILTDTIRERIRRNSGLPVFNEYGCGEVGSIAHECAYGSMHIMADNLIIEIDENNEIIVTDLHNYAMPLIRYRLNDFAQFSNDQCQCGCEFPVINKIYGRSYDLIKLSDGKKAHPEIIMYIFEEFKQKYSGLIQFQFLQHSILNFSINLVIQKKDFNKNFAENYLAKRINEILSGSFSIDFSYVEKIEREKSGKIRIVKSNI